MDLEQNIKNQSNIANKRPFIEWSFVFLYNQIKRANLIISHKPSNYLYFCHINLISQNKSQKKSKFLSLTY